MSGLMRHQKAWGGRDYGYKPNERVYSALEGLQLRCEHKRQETISMDTVLVCLDFGKEEVIK